MKTTNTKTSNRKTNSKQAQGSDRQHNSQPDLFTPTQPSVPSQKQYGVIKLGVDVHADRFVVTRQIDGAAPQPAQGFGPDKFLDFAKKQTALADKVFCCYEAGPFGYLLHRKLQALGLTNHVVRPRDWDEYGPACGIKTD